MGFRMYINTPDGRYKWDKFLNSTFPSRGRSSTRERWRGLRAAWRWPSRAASHRAGAERGGHGWLDNEYMRARIEQMRDGVERGESISRTATATGVFNPVVLQMIAVGEETGDMDGLMLEVAGMYEREVEYDVKNLSAQIEPIMITGWASWC